MTQTCFLLLYQLSLPGSAIEMDSAFRGSGKKDQTGTVSTMCPLLNLPPELKLDLLRYVLPGDYVSMIPPSQEERHTRTRRTLGEPLNVEI